jgi:hypothetical protein
MVLKDVLPEAVRGLRRVNTCKACGLERTTANPGGNQAKANQAAGTCISQHRSPDGARICLFLNKRSSYPPNAS